jgi:hypothetical protein
MNRIELIRRLVLNAICDGYQNVDQVILQQVSEGGAMLGLTVITRSEILDALAGLIADGLAKAYLLSSREPHSTELQGMPSLDVVEENFTTYFDITKKGMDFHLSDDTWRPFDDEGAPRKA